MIKHKIYDNPHTAAMRCLNQRRKIIKRTEFLTDTPIIRYIIAIINHGKIVTNRSIRELLRDLNKEVFLLDCADTLPAEIAVNGFELKRLDDHCLEVVINKGQDLTAVFRTLGDKQISVVSMRNEANRLEQMFVNLLEQSA